MAGGRGGYGSQGAGRAPGGAGGTGYASNTNAGSDGGGGQTGGGGGGGAGGGRGGETGVRYGRPQYAGGGTTPGQAGKDGTGGGGAGGGNGSPNGSLLGANIATISAQDGGKGGAGYNGAGIGGGGGGAGGYGIVAGDTGVASNAGRILGGAGGQGGAGGSNAQGGGGGDGGVGVLFQNTGVIFNNTGIVTGGAGGTAGANGAGNNSTTVLAGLGGAGVVGGNLSITNTGSITGGMGNGGQADAIDIIGSGNNRLTLGDATRQGILSGGIGIGRGNQLSIDPGTSAGVSRTLANQIHDLEINGILAKIGAGTLILTGANTYTGPTFINAGTLQLGDNGITGSIFPSSIIRIDSDGTLAVNHTNQVTLVNNIGGSGALQQNGSGVLTLGASNNSYTGAVALNSGTLELGRINSAGSGAITFAAGAQKLQIDATGTLGNTLTAVGTGDRLDFQAVSFSGAQKAYNAASHTLSVSNGGLSTTVRFDAGSTLTNDQLLLSADVDGSALITVRAPPAPTGSFPLNGNRVIFDGTTNVTATKGDALILTVDPQNFNGGAEQNGNVVLSTIDGHTATIQNAFLTSDGIPNTFVPNGDFLVGRDGFALTSTKQNSILIGLPGSEDIRDVVDPSLAAGSHFISGGVGRFDQTDGADTITIGGKGKWAVYANAGNDVVTQDTATTSGFDSASVVNVYGQEGADSITLTNAANIKASIFVSGGTEGDSISVVNSGTTTIFGGVDSADGADSITFNGVTAGGGTAGGTSLIFGNGGNDTISVGNTGTGLDSTSTSTVYGGFGNDQITMKGVKATLSVLGGEGSDSITVSNTGTTFITGGNQSGADQLLDGADSITFTGSGNALVYGNIGNDTINLILQGGDSTTTSNVSVYGGKDNDIVNVGLQNGIQQAKVFVAGGEGSDTINIGATDSASAVTVYGGTSASDSADGADQISIGSGAGGTINVFGNGGADTIQVGQLSFDSANTATIYGGGGADSIVVATQVNGAESLVLTGNENADTFSINKGTGQTITVADFKVSEGDNLRLTGLGGTPGGLQVATGSYQTLQDALNAAANASGGTAGQSKAAAVAFAGSTYVVIEQGGAGFQAGTDQAIKLTGVTDLVGVIGVTTLSASA